MITLKLPTCILELVSLGFNAVNIINRLKSIKNSGVYCEA